MRYRFTLTNSALGSQILENSPVGWDKMEVLIKRGLEYHGFFYEQNVSLEFFCGAGKEFIDQVQEEQGIDGEILITIEVACGCNTTTGAPDYSIDYSDDYGSQGDSDCEYETFYEGKINLKTWDADAEFTRVEIIQAGILQTVRNRLDTKIDLFNLETLDGTALTDFNFGPYDLTLHSKVIIFTSLFQNLDPVLNETLAYDNNHDVVFVFPIYPEVDEHAGGETPGALPINVTTGGEPDYFYQNDDTVRTFSIEYDLSGTVVDSNHALGSRVGYAGLFIELRTVNDGDNFLTAASTNVLVNYGPDVALASGTYTKTITPIQGTLSKTLQAGQKLYLTFYFDGIITGGLNASDFSFTLNDGSFVKLTSETTTPATTAKAFAVFEAGARIAQAITDQTDAFRSSYFGRKNSQPFSYSSNGCGSFRANLNGFMVRGFPITGDNARTIRMSMNDYFKGYNAIDNLGLGIEKTGDDYFIVIEKKSYFYDSSTVLLTIDHARNFKRMEAPEYYYGRVNVGYSKWETEFTNGLDEFNSKRQFDTGIKAVENGLEILSELVASGYRLEASRRKQYSESFTEDSEYDEDNFVVCLNKSVDGSGVPNNLDEAEKDENFTQVNNILSPETSYNLDISPVRNYLRWNPVINAGLTKYPAREVKFTSGEGNYKMTSELSASTCPGRWNNNLISEGANIQWDHADNSDKDPIWLPEKGILKHPVSFSEYQTIYNNPKGCIEVSETDEDHVKYFILDFLYKPNDLSEFILLRVYE